MNKRWEREVRKVSQRKNTVILQGLSIHGHALPRNGSLDPNCRGGINGPSKHSESREQRNH